MRTTHAGILKTVLLSLIAGGAVAVLGGCADTFHRQPLPPGSLGEKLEHAGANYQATEAAPNYRDEKPNESMREVRDRRY